MAKCKWSSKHDLKRAQKKSKEICYCATEVAFSCGHGSKFQINLVLYFSDFATYMHGIRALKIDLEEGHIKEPECV